MLTTSNRRLAGNSTCGRHTWASRANFRSLDDGDHLASNSTRGIELIFEVGLDILVQLFWGITLIV